MSLKVVALGVTFALSGWATEPAVTYEVAVSKSFDVEEQAAIVSGMRSWEKAVPALRFHMRLEESCDSSEAIRHCITIAPATRDEMISMYGEDKSIVGLTGRRHDGHMAVYLGYGIVKDPVHRTEVAAHELGHAMGIGHYNLRSSLMYPYMSEVTGPSMVDVMSWYMANGA